MFKRPTLASASMWVLGGSELKAIAVCSRRLGKVLLDPLVLSAITLKADEYPRISPGPPLQRNFVTGSSHDAFLSILLDDAQ
ncbi:hypothetical protein PLEOSDRAFT_1099564 [Pleurotus ostreatus PC15]|nr:hypothetical protein PLEOSDRAFT_1099564 [Pleurotus ostreatus PC15]